MRISGIASGFDTDAMVKSMMAVERMKVDRFEKSKQLALWKQESYNTMNKAFANFILNTQKDMGLKKAGSTGIITNSSYKNVDYVKKATSSNEAAATVTSSSKAVNGSYKLDIEQLAEGASFNSDKIDESILVGKKYLEFKINGEVVRVGKEGGDNDITMDDVVKAINSATKEDPKDSTKQVSLGISAFYDKSNGKLFMQTKEIGKNAKIVLSDAPFTGTSKQGQDSKVKFNGVDLTYSSNKFNINGLDIELKGVTTDPVTKVENPIFINVSTNTQGIMEKIEKLVKDYNDLIDLASLSVNQKAYPGYQPLTAEERKAMSESDVKLWDEKAKSGLLNRDETIQRTLQSIRNDLYKTVDGLEGFNHITQIGITTEKYSRGSAGGKLTIDTDKLKAAIEENPDAVMDLLFREGPKKPTEPSKPIPPTPLVIPEEPQTDDPDFDKKWEQYELDLAKYNEVDLPKYNEDLEKYEAAETKYNETDLPKYNADLDAYNKIAKSSDKTYNGIFTNIYENLITGMQAIIDKSGPGQDSDLLRGVKSNILIDFVTKKSSISDLDKTVQEMNRKMDNLNILLAKKEDSYYAKFTAMEKAMHKMNSQSGWLAQQFG